MGAGFKTVWRSTTGRDARHATSLYQLRDEKWVALDSPSADNEIERRANDIVADQLKAQGLSEKKLSKQGKYLRFIWWTVNVDRWVDSNTAIAYASLRRVAARRDAPGKMDDGYGTDLLFTLRFDGARQMEDRQNASDVGERSRRAPMSCFFTFVAMVVLTIGRDFSNMPPHEAN